MSLMIARSQFNGAPKRVAAKSAATVPFALALIVIVLWLPPEMSFFVFGLRFTVVRLIFLLLAPILIVKWVQRFSSGNYHFILSDPFFVLTGFWMIFAPANVDGLTDALNHAGPDVLEICIGYTATRILLSDHGQALRFADLYCRLISIVALIGLVDTITGHYVTREFARSVTGNRFYSVIEWTDSHRLGLLRATGPTEHPIWFGFMCGIGLLIAISIPVRLRPFVMVSSGLGLVFSLSSAPLQCTVIGIGLLIYNRAMLRFRFRWLVLFGLGAAGIITAFLISNNPVGFIIAHLIYDPASGYFRVWTWDQVTFFVSQSPWYGLGFAHVPEAINHSIDSLWLVLAIHYGWPGAVLVALSISAAGSAPTAGSKSNLTPLESKLGTTLGIVAFLTLILGFTVHLLGMLWILTGLLAGVKAHLGELAHRNVQNYARAGAHRVSQLKVTA